MAPLPKRKLSKARGRTRLAGQIKLNSTISSLTICPNCQKKTYAHRACFFCGYYKGKKVISVASK